MTKVSFYTLLLIKIVKYMYIMKDGCSLYEPGSFIVDSHNGSHVVKPTTLDRLVVVVNMKKMSQLEKDH